MALSRYSSDGGNTSSASSSSSSSRNRRRCSLRATSVVTSYISRALEWSSAGKSIVARTMKPGICLERTHSQDESNLLQIGGCSYYIVHMTLRYLMETKLFQDTLRLYGRVFVYVYLYIYVYIERYLIGPGRFSVANRNRSQVGARVW